MKLNKVERKKLRIRSKLKKNAGNNRLRLSVSRSLKNISAQVDKYLSKYENIIVMGDLNCPVTEVDMDNFCDTYDLVNLITEPTCFKGVANTSSIDVLLTSFENSITIETGLSDCHKMT